MLIVILIIYRHKQKLLTNPTITTWEWGLRLTVWSWSGTGDGNYDPRQNDRKAASMGDITDITRLRMVKNTNLFWDSKKLFFIFWKTVYWVTEHFCIKWTFWKNVIFCPKNAFFGQKWQFDTLDSMGQHHCQGTFFLGGNFTQIFEAKKLRKV